MGLAGHNPVHSRDALQTDGCRRAARLRRRCGVRLCSRSISRRRHRATRWMSAACPHRRFYLLRLARPSRPASCDVRLVARARTHEEECNAHAWDGCTLAHARVYHKRTRARTHAHAQLQPHTRVAHAHVHSHSHTHAYERAHTQSPTHTWMDNCRDHRSHVLADGPLPHRARDEAVQPKVGSHLRPLRY